jgi:hypothetical protein
VKRQVARKVRREIFVLTPEEKRAVCFVLIAFLLGLATQYYRAPHLPQSSTTDLRENAPAIPIPAQKRIKKKRPAPPPK